MTPPTSKSARVEVGLHEGEVRLRVTETEDATYFNIDGQTFRKMTSGQWKNLGTGFTIDPDDSGVIDMPVNDLYKGKGSSSGGEDEEEAEDKIKGIMGKKWSTLEKEEADMITEYQKQKLDQMAEEMLRMTKEISRREKEAAKNKSKNVFDVFEDYLIANKLGSEESVLGVDLQSIKEENDDNEEAPPENNNLLDQEQRKGIEVMAQAFKAAGIGGMAETRWAEFPKFGGGEEDPYEWIEQYEAACEVNSVKGPRMLELVSANLEGSALAWWRSVKKVIKEWENWKTEDGRKKSFKYQFLTRFCGAERQQRWMDELRSKKQRPGETVGEYYGKLQSLYQKADPIGQYPERDFYQQFLKGLRTELRHAVRLAATTNLREAVEKAKAAEAAYSMDGALAGYSLVKGGIDSDLRRQLGELKEMLAKSTQERCDLCYKTGHQPRNCPQRSFKAVQESYMLAKITSISK